ncbi:MAG TPA: AbrB/MazE/SpoVT family DNA-binding domain-containing protein [Candidatus Omnitrophica bacterium]|nr:AbrB/MazE/SpoVT family DNA-binding domain-containing protein [Candidatus Omnitrophota bacterium]
MLCKKTYKNQITLPKKIIERFKGVEYFEAEAEEDKIILRPVKIIPAKGVSLFNIREKISSLGISKDYIDKAILWARKKK